MKKLITIGLICLVFFVSLAALSNNPQFSMIQNQGGAVQVKLTHQATHVFQITHFNILAAQYSDTEGNATLILSSESPYDFLGNYSFTDDTIGGNPADWTSIEGAGYGINVIESLNDHAMVVNHSDATGGGNGGMYQDFAAAHTSGIVEFWARQDADDARFNFRLFRADLAEVIYVLFDTDGNINYLGTGMSNNTICEYAADTWYHFSIDYNTTGFQVEINGVLYGAGRTFSFPNAMSGGLTRFTFCNHFYGGPWNGYIDAIDYSWAPGYYFNRNNDTTPTYTTEGSYLSPALDLGEYNNYFVTYINLSYSLPDDSDIAGAAQFSEDNITWSGWLPFSGFPNVTVGFECGRYLQFYINLTAATDLLDTPELYSLLVELEETVLNEVPAFADISPANNSVGLNPDMPINCTILDADADLLNISLYVNDTLINSASNCDNGSLYYYLFHGNYSTTYAFYFELTDGENTTTSDLYLCTTGDEPEEEEPTIQTATVDDLFIAIGAVGFVLLTAAANIRKRRV